jgi:DNA recombination protein RmuC
MGSVIGVIGLGALVWRGRAWDFQRRETDSLLAAANERISELEKEQIRLETEALSKEEFLRVKDEEYQRQQQESQSRFENLANRIFHDNTQRFEEQSAKSISNLISPLRDKIGEFERRVNETYDTESRERFALKEELQRMFSANEQLRDDTRNLTTALKGDVKFQGDWGEIQLERILEHSGLIEGDEFSVEAAGMQLRDEKGRIMRPDVIVNLPDEKHIIIDSKLSMGSYSEYATSENDDDREFHLKAFIRLTKRHVDNLSKRHYQDIKKLHSPDFVLMFCPLEGAFSAIMHAGSDLFGYAWDKRVILVSPTNLLASLRTIASIWKTERQNRNALEIARQAGAMYDKFVGFVGDLEKVGKSLSQASKDHQGAITKLSDGRGNLVASVERLRKLGAKTAKKIDKSYLPERDQESETEL